MKEDRVVMYDSAEAATRVNMPGWKSRWGHFYPGDNAISEQGARWAGCTHMTCECGNVHEKMLPRCASCQAKQEMERFEALPEIEWDRVTPLALFDDDRWFWDEGDLLDYLADCVSDPDTVRVVICEPGKLHLLDGSIWEDDLPEDGELPDAVATALDSLNAAIRTAEPVSWWHGKQRINLEPFWKKLKEAVI